MKTIKKGALYYVDTDGGRKNPVVIVQDVDQRWESKTILIAPISTIIKKKKPTYIQVPQFNKIRKNSYILIEKIHPIYKSKIQGYIGMLDKEQIEEINFLLRILFQI